VPRTENTFADARTRRQSDEDCLVESSDEESEIEKTFTRRSQMFSNPLYSNTSESNHLEPELVLI
jgi:hypothetical protein